MTELETDFLIVGGGFSGLIAAWSARRAGRSVLLVEKSPRLGGVLNSEPWGELAVDYGCHVFDNSDDEVTALLFEMAGADAFAPAPITYASRLGGLQSDGIALLDLSRQAPDLQARVLFETVRAAASDQGPAGSATASGPTDANLAEALRRRFGATAASVLDAAARKIFQCASAELSASALPLTLFQRLRIVPDEMAELLKAAPPLDDRIAVSSAANPLRFYPRVARYPHRNFYPAAGGMGGFVTRAEAALARAGVGVSTGVAVDRLEAEGAALRADLSDGRVVRAGRMMAASGLPTVEALLGVETPSIGAKTHSAALVLFYFLAPETAFTGLSYVHSFDPEEMVFRASAPGVYGRQRDAAGRTYAVCEAPTTRGSALWERPEDHVARAWDELRAMRIVDAPAYDDVKILKTPVSAKLPKVGFDAAADALRAAFAARFPQALISDPLAFSKERILADVGRLLGGL